MNEKAPTADPGSSGPHPDSGKSAFGGVWPELPLYDLDPKGTALLIVDMQYLDAHPDYGLGRHAKEIGIWDRYEYYFQSIEQMLPRLRRLLEASREHGYQVIHAVIAALTRDCRDISLEHVRMRLEAPLGSKEAEILEELEPIDNEIVLTKTASGVFNATAIDQVLRNLRVHTLIICGVATNYCVESAVRDAADRGYSVVMVEDACATLTPEAHRWAIEEMRDLYAKIMIVEEVIRKMEGWRRS